MVVLSSETSGTVVCMFSVVQKRIALYTVLFWVMHVISPKPNLVGTSVFWESTNKLTNISTTD